MFFNLYCPNYLLWDSRIDAWAAASLASGTLNGEHGGDPSSVEFCHKTGLTYVSCSPFRVPIARLAAAQASIRESQSK